MDFTNLINTCTYNNAMVEIFFFFFFLFPFAIHMSTQIPQRNDNCSGMRNSKDEQHPPCLVPNTNRLFFHNNKDQLIE